MSKKRTRSFQRVRKQMLPDTWDELIAILGNWIWLCFLAAKAETKHIELFIQQTFVEYL